MKKILLLAMFPFLTVSCGKKIKEPEFTRQFSIHSAVTQATYDIRVALPEGYDRGNETFVTVFVLDGEQDFNLVAAECKNLMAKHQGAKVLVVSIGYGRNRTMDYTPTVAEQGQGGAPEFQEFIAGELIPRLENDFSADTARMSRVLVGHSFGGLFGTYAFARNNRTFGNYILLSPSIWYDNEIVLKYEEEERGENQGRGCLVFMGIGEQENSGRMQAPFEAFHRRLKAHYPHAKLRRHTEPGLDHVGSKNPNLRKGLEFYFQNR
jgi:uncharacterized protein